MSFLWNEVLVKPLLNLLLFLYNIMPGHDLGLVIIVITIFIRLIVLPFSLKASRAQRKMKRLAPELAKLKDTHKNDQQALAKAQMEFYKQNGVSPFTSCLPVLIQLPILFALYQVLREGLTIINPSQVYSFIHLPEKISPMFFGFLDLSRPEKYVLPIIAGLSQYILGVMTTPAPGKNAGPEAAMTKQMIFIFPMMTVFLSFSVPAGLVFYWIATTLFSILTQVYVNHEKNKEVTVRVKTAGADHHLVIQEVVEGEIAEEEKKD